jgi:fructose-bisphosphate aldolase class II
VSDGAKAGRVRSPQFFAAATKAASDLCRARFEQFGCAGRASSIKPVSLDRMTEM